MHSTFADRLDSALNGRKPAWLAKEIGISASTLTGYRKGSLPSADVVFRLSDALGVDARWLITGHGSPNPGATQANRSVGEVRKRLDEIESRLHELADVREEVLAPEFAGLREELSALATDEILPPTTRARADLILRLIYEDQDAEARQQRRTRHFRAELKRQYMIVDDALEEHSWGAASAYRDTLHGLVMHYGVDKEGLGTVIRAMEQLAQKSDNVAKSVD